MSDCCDSNLGHSRTIHQQSAPDDHFIEDFDLSMESQTLNAA